MSMLSWLSCLSYDSFLFIDLISTFNIIFLHLFLSIMITMTSVFYSARISRICYLFIISGKCLLIGIFNYYKLDSFFLAWLFFCTWTIFMEILCISLYESICNLNIFILNQLNYTFVFVIFLEILVFLGLDWLNLNHVLNSLSYHYQPYEFISDTGLTGSIHSFKIFQNLLFILYITLAMHWIHMLFINTSS